MAVATNITPPRVAFLDPRTGAVSREWYMFFLSLFKLTGGGQTTITLEDLQRLPSAPDYSGELAGISEYLAGLPPAAPIDACASAAPPAVPQPIHDDVAPRHEPILPPDLVAGANISITTTANTKTIATTGASGTFITVDGKIVTVASGIITGIV